MSNTWYQFAVAAGAFEGALDRFSSFFYCPLFTPSATARQVSAVDLEHKMYLQQDGWREFSLKKALMDPKNPISKFFVGNTSTLMPTLHGRDADTISDKDKEEAGLEARQHLIEWWKKWYCASNMSLVLIGKESLDKLQSFAKTYFNSVPNQGIGPASRISDYPFSKENSGIITYMKTVRDFCSLELTFPMPYSRDLWKSKPHEFIAKLLLDQSPGSIYAYLNTKGWISQGGSCIHANDLSNGVSQFNVSIFLTKDGLSEYPTLCYSTSDFT